MELTPRKTTRRHQAAPFSPDQAFTILRKHSKLGVTDVHRFAASLRYLMRRATTSGPCPPSAYEFTLHSSNSKADVAARGTKIVSFRIFSHPLTMKEELLAQIRNMFDVPVMQNSLRGLWVELMVCDLLGGDWQHTGNDWAAWDLERSDGLRIEVKQSARMQSWGASTGCPRFSITAAKGHYPDGKSYVINQSGKRLANLYIFAWHDGCDQRSAAEWQFYVIEADRLPEWQKSIGQGALQKMTEPIRATELLREVTRLCC